MPSAASKQCACAIGALAVSVLCAVYRARREVIAKRNQTHMTVNDSMTEVSGHETGTAQRHYHMEVKKSLDMESTLVTAIQAWAFTHNGYCPDALPAAGNVIKPGFTYGIGCHHPEVRCDCPAPSIFYACEVQDMPFVNKFGYCKIAMWVWFIGVFLIAMIPACIGYVSFRGSSANCTEDWQTAQPSNDVLTHGTVMVQANRGAYPLPSEQQQQQQYT